MKIELEMIDASKQLPDSSKDGEWFLCAIDTGMNDLLVMPMRFWSKLAKDSDPQKCWSVEDCAFRIWYRLEEVAYWAELSSVDIPNKEEGSNE